MKRNPYIHGAWRRGRIHLAANSMNNPVFSLTYNEQIVWIFGNERELKKHGFVKYILRQWGKAEREKEPIDFFLSSSFHFCRHWVDFLEKKVTRPRLILFFGPRHFLAQRFPPTSSSFNGRIRHGLIIGSGSAEAIIVVIILVVVWQGIKERVLWPRNIARAVDGNHGPQTLLPSLLLQFLLFPALSPIAIRRTHFRTTT